MNKLEIVKNKIDELTNLIEDWAKELVNENDPKSKEELIKQSIMQYKNSFQKIKASFDILNNLLSNKQFIESYEQIDKIYDQMMIKKKKK